VNAVDDDYNYSREALIALADAGGTVEERTTALSNLAVVAQALAELLERYPDGRIREMLAERDAERRDKPASRQEN
jgi:hypothetical protein